MRFSLELCRPQPLEKMFLTRGSDEPFHSLRFLDGNLPTRWSKPIVTAPLVVFFRRWPMPALLDRAVNQKALDDGIQSTGAEPHVTIGLILNFFQDGVAMLLTIPQGQQDLKHGGRKRSIHCYEPFLLADAAIAALTIAANAIVCQGP